MLGDEGGVQVDSWSRAVASFAFQCREDLVYSRLQISRLSPVQRDWLGCICIVMSRLEESLVDGEGHWKG